MNVSVFHNVSTDPQGRSNGIEYGYRTGDALSKVYEFDYTGDLTGTALCEFLYELFNVGDDPTFHNPPNPIAVAYRKSGGGEYGIRSLSKGDVIEVGGVWFAVARFGFEELPPLFLADGAHRGFVMDGNHRIAASGPVDLAAGEAWLDGPLL